MVRKISSSADCALRAARGCARVEPVLERVDVEPREVVGVEALDRDVRVVQPERAVVVGHLARERVERREREPVERLHPLARHDRLPA